MKHFEKIHQHINNILEQRGLHKSLCDIFKKHRLISFKSWRIFSFVVLFPLCLYNAHCFSHIASVFSNGQEVSDISIQLINYMFGISAFLFPVGISTLLLTEYLPLYKLSQKSFFKKHLEKYFRKNTTIASSCDLVNYKEEFILKYSNDKELNLAMSSYYQYLLEFPFPLDTKKFLINKRDNLLNIELDPDLYQKQFVNTVIKFIEDFDKYSKSPIVLKNCYEKEVLDYTDNMLSAQNSQHKDDELYQEFCAYMNNEKEKQKKSFKDML